MRRWLRWQGLAAFVVLCAGIAVLWYVLIDGIIKRAIEKTGTAILGAKVELEKADLSLLPLGLTLTGLQAADPDKPMQNALEARRVAFLMDGGNLLRRKVVIEEMAVEGVRLGTPRKTSGAIHKKPKAAGEPTKLHGLEFPSLSIPDPKEILEKEKLEALALASSLKERVKAEETALKATIEGLPGKADLKAYEVRVKEIQAMAKKGGLSAIQAAADASKLKSKLDGDIKNFKRARDELRSGVEGLKQEISRIDDSVKADVARLRKKYSPGLEGVAGVSGLLFGPRISEWTNRALRWYRKIGPPLDRYMEKRKAEQAVKPVRAKGLDIVFKENNPLPGFLIRRAAASVELKEAGLSGIIENITNDQAVLGKPATFAFEAQKMKKLTSASISGSIDHRVPGKSRDALRLSMLGYGLEDVAISESGDFPLSLARGSLDMEIRASVTGKALEADATAALKSASLMLGGEQDRLRKALASALSDVKGFTVNASITGTPDNYGIHIRSDLDSVLRASLEKLVREQAEELSRELKAGIEQRLDGPKKELLAAIGGLDVLGADISGRQASFEELLNQTVKTIGAGGAGKGSLPGGVKLPF